MRIHHLRSGGKRRPVERKAADNERYGDRCRNDRKERLMNRRADETVMAVVVKISMMVERHDRDAQQYEITTEQPA